MKADGTQSSDVAADEADIRQTLAGDGDAYARLVARHQSRVAGTLWRFTRDPNEWERLVQDVFVEAFVSLAKVRDPSRFGSWLQTVTLRVGYQFWKHRDRARGRQESSLSAETGPGDVAVMPTNDSDTAELVHRLLDQLPPRDRLVLTLMYLEQMSLLEIAEQTGWSRTLVKVQAHRARGKLKRLLERSVPDGSDLMEVLS